MLRWQGRDSHGASVASGVYLARMTWNGEGIATRRMVLLK